MNPEQQKQLTELNLRLEEVEKKLKALTEPEWTCAADTMTVWEWVFYGAWFLIAIAGLNYIN